jgi:serine/threonine-protein kinase
MATIAAGDRRIDLAHAPDFRLASARIRPALLQIQCGDASEVVEPRVMQMLVALHRAGGTPVSRDDLIADCWGGLSISDHAITQCVSKLRRALAAVPGVQVESVPRVGYRLTGSVGDPSSPSGRRDGLSRRAAINGIVAVAGSTAAWVLLKPHPVATADSIAVLPFANLSRDPSQAYLSDGISEEVRSALSRLVGLKVVGRTSSEALRKADAVAAARTLHVTNVLTGSVRRSPTTIRVAAQLIDGRTGFETWSQTYDLAPADAIQLQTEIARSVALALRVRLGRSDHAALAAGGTGDATANDLFLQAKLAFRLSDTEATFRKVIALCDAAIDIDPNYADAHALKGMAWDAIAGAFATDPRELDQAYANGAASARKAIAIAPQVATGYAALARAMSGRLNVRGALEVYKTAERLAGNDAGVLGLRIHTLAEIGRTTEALVLGDKLVRLDPLNSEVFGRLAFAHFYARRFDRAITSSMKALSLAPALTEQQSLIGDCLCLLGKYDEAASQYAKAPPLDLFRLTGEGIVAARRGDSSRAQQILTKLERAYGIGYQIAQVHAQLGELDQAFAALARGRSVLDPGLNALPADPFVDPLRRDPRFAVLIAQMNFPKP